jgi:polynucleotide 5'-hydroxyl-kinase GRC3/NOL9
MRHVIQENKTLLVDGPACLNFLKGEARILGAPLKIEEKIVIREGKRIPIEVNKKAMFDLALGENASFEEVAGSTIPPSWEKVSEEIKLSDKPMVVMVIGGIDSGKTSFCVYLANEALKKKLKVAVIDADLGQSDIGPPSTIALSRIAAPVKDLFDVEAENAYFVGLTSPERAVDRVLEGLTALKSRFSENAVNILIVNTDGWIEGEDAVKYKVKLVEIVNPDVIVGIQQGDKLAPILDALKGAKIFAVDSPKEIRGRNREKRKILRELNYKKYLRKAKVQSFPLSRVNIEGIFFKNGGFPAAKQMAKIENALGGRPVYFEEMPNSVLLVLRINEWVNGEQIKNIESSFGKKLKILKKGEEEGLLVSLEDAKGNFLGIGVLSGIDYERRTVKVYTPVNGNISTIRLGQIKLDKKGREVGLIPFIWQNDVY